MTKSVHCEKKRIGKRICVIAFCVAVTAALVILGCGDKGTGSGSDDDLLDRFGRPMYALTTNVSPEDGGRVERSPDSTRYPQDTEVTVTAIPEDGYEFIGWSGASMETTPAIVITMSDSLTLIANFQLITISDERYSLTVTPNPTAGGTVSREPDSTDYAHGAQVTATAKPNSGFRFLGWSGASMSTEYSITVTMNSNLALIAGFEPIPPNHYTLFVEWEPTEGFVTRSPAAASYISGTQVNVTATANPGYTFVGWSGASNSTNATVTITMDDDKELAALFEPVDDILHTLTVVKNPAAGGTVFVNNIASTGVTAHNPDAQITVRAEAAPGYKFTGWQGASTSEDAEITLNMEDDLMLTANFQQIYILTINRDPVAGGTVFVNDIESIGTTTHDAGTQTTLRAEAAPGYKFTGWTGALTSTNTEITFTMSSNQTLIANFKQNFTLTVNRNLTFGGTVTPTSVTSYDFDTPANITATPASDYRFSNWVITSGQAQFADAYSAITTVTLSSNTTITANFKFNYFNPEMTYGLLIDERDDQRYHTIKIGTQTWMAENLNYTTADSWCYDDSTSNCEIYGRLYTWDAAINACQELSGGWRLPTNADWDNLASSADGSSIALKSTKGWDIISGTSTNESGFSALPGGQRHPLGIFSTIGYQVGWWSATEFLSGEVFGRSLDALNVLNLLGNKNNGYSVRCVKD